MASYLSIASALGMMMAIGACGGEVVVDTSASTDEGGGGASGALKAQLTEVTARIDVEGSATAGVSGKLTLDNRGSSVRREVEIKTAQVMLSQDDQTHSLQADGVANTIVVGAGMALTVDYFGSFDLTNSNARRFCDEAHAEVELVLEWEGEQETVLSGSDEPVECTCC